MMRFTMKMVTEPSKRTAAKVPRHNLTHIPAADWHEHGQKGKGKDKDHNRAEGWPCSDPDRLQLRLKPSKMQLRLSFLQWVMQVEWQQQCHCQPGTGRLVTWWSHSWGSWATCRTEGKPALVQVAVTLRDELNKTRLKDAVVRAYTDKTSRYSQQRMGHVGAKLCLIKGDALTMKSAAYRQSWARSSPSASSALHVLWWPTRPVVFFSRKQPDVPNRPLKLWRGLAHLWHCTLIVPPPSRGLMLGPPA